MSIDELAALLDQDVSTLSDKVAERQRELAGEAERLYDATGFFICSVTHREDLHARSFQYAENHLKREGARRIAKAISRLPDLPSGGITDFGLWTEKQKLLRDNGDFRSA